MERVRKTIPEARDRAQSRALVWIVGALLAWFAVALVIATRRLGLPLRTLRIPLVFSAGFAVLVLRLRAATPAAAAMGFLVCFILAQSPLAWAPYVAVSAPPHALTALVAVFVLTYAATKFGRKRKEARGLAEPRQGRRASQIVANLGAAALFAAAGRYEGCIAALAEAAADTVSSEIGQAVGGEALLVTSWKRVPAGTDGGITIVGTVAGLVAGAVVAALGAMHQGLWPGVMKVWMASCVGLFFDSVLGATLERRGWLGNDWVNFCSTIVAGLVAMVLG